jgi:hypothetical protein
MKVFIPEPQVNANHILAAGLKHTAGSNNSIGLAVQTLD